MKKATPYKMLWTHLQEIKGVVSDLSQQVDDDSIKMKNKLSLKMFIFFIFSFFLNLLKFYSRRFEEDYFTFATI